MEIPDAWLTCDEFVRFKADALGAEPHEGATLHERMLERVALKLGLQVAFRPAPPEPTAARCALVRVVGARGVAMEAGYGEALAWLMAGAPDAEARALARAERSQLEATAAIAGASSSQATRRI